METYTVRATTHVMVNFRVKPEEKRQLEALALRLQGGKRHHRYNARQWSVSISDVLRWGIEALIRELDADQARATEAEFNKTHPPKVAKKPAGRRPTKSPR